MSRACATALLFQLFQLFWCEIAFLLAPVLARTHTQIILQPLHFVEVVNPHAECGLQRVEQQMVKEDEKDRHERAKLREQQRKRQTLLDQVCYRNAMCNPLAECREIQGTGAGAGTSNSGGGAGGGGGWGRPF